MIEVCFSQNVRTLLCLAKNFGVGLGDIALFPDDLTLGSISNMNPHQRRSELEKLSIHPAEDFEEQYASFADTVSHASELSWSITSAKSRLFDSFGVSKN